MDRVLCWDPDEASTIINPDADEVPEAVLRAVHVDRPLWIQDGSVARRGQGQQINAAGVLERFLDPKRRHMQMAIIGEAGSGKSHLVAWLRLQIPERTDRVVLAIPKAGTSLRDIAHRLIKQLSPQLRATFEEEFQRIGTRTLNRDQQRETILNNLSVALSGHHPDGTSTGDRDLEEHLTEHLPALLHDPHFRKSHFLKPGSFVDELAEHVFAAPGTYEPRTERQTIRRRDLAFSGLDVKNASQPAREALDALDSEDSINAARALLDRYVDEAIAMSLSFTGDRLIALMNAVRGQFKDQGKSLVLLIEDLARLQGIDRALLQALIKQGDGDHCEIRWAFAITDQPYEAIPDTVRTRMDWVVDLNGNQAVRTERGLVASFTARYMNAIRLGLSRLERIPPGEPIRSACDDCTHREPCHRTFGADDGMGLYPFTETAAWRMAQRVDPDVEERFNPRAFQKRVLRPLTERGGLLKEGAFPPEDFLRADGLQSLPIREIRKLENADPRDNRRRLAFLDFWSEGQQACNLDPLLHEAFDLRFIPDFGTVELPGPSRPRPRPMDPPLDRDQDALDNWAKGGTLPATLATNLREYVYDALVEVVDWDAEGLERSTFAAPTGSRVPFRRAAIQFLRQPTQGTTAFQLVLPLHEDELLETAIALQGLLTARTRGLEEVEPEARATLFECLARWGQTLVTRLRALDDVGPCWDPVAAATELLAIGALLVNEVGRSDVTTEAILRAIFADWRGQPDHASRELADVADRILRSKEMLADLVHARLGGGKGGNTGALLDPLRPLGAIRALRRSEWRLVLEPPGDPQSKELKDLADLYTLVRRRLPESLEAERQARVGWAQDIASELGTTKATDLRRIVTELRDAIGGAALGVSLNALDDGAFAGFEPRVTDDARVRAEGLPSADEIRIVHLGPARAGAMRSARSLVEALGAVVAQAERVVSLKLEGGGEGQTVLSRARGEIRTDLDLIDGHLATLERARAYRSHK